ncbi:hypothetical protein A0J48_023940 [Sphaerospermopsis aphanizomenoides BCCUSP55]|nr:hypothetical protein [Sphaerospermopsis aphanizomenoides BCCUSP55]
MWLGLAVPDLAPAQTNPPALNFISEIKGDVQIKRSQWKSYHKANVGDLLNFSDQLQLRTGASAKVMCSNLSVWHLRGNSLAKVADGCSSGILTVIRPGHRTNTRSPSNSIPYIISPRNTALLNNRPILRWNGVPGATRYKVQVKDAGLSLDWQTETSNTQIEYPGQPVLQPNFSYLLTVETNKGDSSREDGVKLNFTLLDTQTAESVRTKVAILKQQKLTHEAEGLGLAYLYQSYNLKSEAINLLEDLVKRGSQTSAVYQFLGDLYLQVGLSKESKISYIKALEQAKLNKDIEGQAEAQVQLGLTENDLNNKTEATRWLTQAQTNYQKLGDTIRYEEVKQWINK